KWHRIAHRSWSKVVQCILEVFRPHSPPPHTHILAVLLNPGCWQYGVMLNRFAAVSEVKQRLQGPHPTSPTQPSSIPHPGPPPSLQCFIHPSPVRYPSPPHRQGQLKPYYLMNAASLLPVLALGVEEGDRVLDLCSAPGGKALAILQTADPAPLCCNEMDPHRRDWLAKTLESFIPQSLSSTSEAGMYDKVLLDAPCSNDRSWLFSGPGGEQHGAVRLRERARLPTLQTQLLRYISALAAVRPGGVAVYSTCTLSRSENQEVVEAVLNTCPGVELQDLEEELALPLQEHFTFTPLGHTPSLGLLVVPQQGQTWGPMFLSRALWFEWST
uniref:NOP2/Sun RNA methyltransferase 3 n=1 Tax=Oncorhynchus kisutch TaxID=8019 RepID=A0A8C7N4N1_ONCKI